MNASIRKRLLAQNQLVNAIMVYKNKSTHTLLSVRRPYMDLIHVEPLINIYPSLRT